MARPTRIEFAGAVYHVITRGNNRQKVFKDDRDHKTYLEKLSHYSVTKDVKLLCYCLQSNHVHLLVETPKGNLSKFMQPFQTSYTVYFNRRHGHSGHVFEQRYKAFLVDRDNYLLQVSRYLHLNPVAASLVKKPRDYRWSSYRGYIEPGAIPAISTEAVLEQLGSKRLEQIRKYREYVEGKEPSSEATVKLPAMTKGIMGDEKFAEQILRAVRVKSVKRRSYSMGEIVDAVCKVTKVDVQKLVRPLRDARVQTARELLMYIARNHTEAGLREIADRLGVRDISTVSHGVRRVEEKLTQGSAAAKELEHSLKRIHSLIQA